MSEKQNISPATELRRKSKLGSKSKMLYRKCKCVFQKLSNSQWHMPDKAQNPRDCSEGFDSVYKYLDSGKGVCFVLIQIPCIDLMLSRLMENNCILIFLRMYFMHLEINA